MLFNLPAGDWLLRVICGIAVDPKRVEEFQQGVAKAIHYAKALNCDQVNCLAGIVPDGVSQQQAEDTFVSNLRFAAQALQENGIRLIVEAINTRDIPGFFLTNTKQALDIIEKVGSDNLNFQYDIYHMQIMEGRPCPKRFPNILDKFNMFNWPIILVVMNRVLVRLTIHFYLNI